MASADPEAARERLRLALDLFASGEALMRQNLRRRYPGVSVEEIEQRLAAWLAHRPGAEHGDAAGSVGRWPRERG